MAPSSPNRTLIRWAAALLVVLVALEILLPTGCIGIEAAVGKKDRTATAVAHLTPERPRDGGSATGTKEWEQAVVVSTSDEVLQLWGAPDRKRVRHGREVWTYRAKGLKWRGIWVWAVLVPVPLQVPTGRNKLRLEFENGQLRYVTVQCRGNKFYGLSLMAGAVQGQTTSFGAGPWQCR